MDEKKENSCNQEVKFFQDLTTQDIEIVVERAFGSTTKLINFQLRDYSEEKLGFLGAYLRLTLTIQKEGNVNRDIHSFFLKGIPYGIESQVSIIVQSNAFKKEAQFYKKIIPELMCSINDKSWIAQCYLVKDDALIFEDLKMRNFALRDKILDEFSLKSGLAALAKLHASSMIAEKRLGSTFPKLYPGVFDECNFLRNGVFYDWIDPAIGLMVKVAEKLNLDGSSIPKVCDRIFDMVSTSKTRRNVVCHGDSKSYNMMFDDTQPIPKCILVDFQLIRYASPMTDVSQMLYLNTRRQYRDNNEKMLLKHYHEVLCETLKENDEKIDLPVFNEILEEYEDMRVEYEDMRVVGLVTSTLYSPTYHLEGKLCAEVTRDSESYKKFMKLDHFEVILDIMRKDSTYNDIITEYVTEMVKKSNQLLKF